MKKIILLAILFASVATVNAQVLPRGIYGTVNPWTKLQPSSYEHSVAKYPDTLKGVDTADFYWTLQNIYSLTVHLQTIQKADSLSGTAILQASDDNSTWQTILTDTLFCTSCVGSFKTFTKATGTTNNVWEFKDLSKFKYYHLQVKGTRTTDTTALNSWLNYGY